MHLVLSEVSLKHKHMHIVLSEVSFDWLVFSSKNIETKNEEDFELRLYIPQVFDISTFSAENRVSLYTGGYSIYYHYYCS